jgi:hypothetical protein
MRKLLLIVVTLSLATLAWAQAGNNLSDEQSGNDFYNQVLSAQVEQFAATNDAISPATQTSEPQASESELPGSMASSQENDWYNQHVMIQAEQNRRGKRAEVSSNF